MRLVTAEEMRQADSSAINEYGIPGIVLMENAGQAVVRQAEKMLGSLAGKKAAIFCGGGNNGGVINTALDGVPVVVSGIPVRYIHAQQGIASWFDFESAVQLAVETAKALTAEIIKGF